jgi:predicted RNA binding protein YcfA (HicA-like mRNA interferase family)
LRRAALERHLEHHDVWRNRATGARSTVPRHREIPNGTVRAICRDLGADVPERAS